MNGPLTYEETFIRDFHAILKTKSMRSLQPGKRDVGMRMYAGAQMSRLTEGWTTMVTSGDAEIQTSLRPMRARSRSSMRDMPFARRARTIVVNNVIGSGIGVQAQVRTTRDDLNKRVNTDIEDRFEEWCDAENCHTGGRMHFSTLEQFIMGQVFEAGEIFLREHYYPFGPAGIPYCLEVIEPERVIDEFQPGPLDPRLRVRMGVECDVYHRPVAYWVRTIHPGEMRYSSQDIDRVERVPADQIIHLAVLDRWPQTRGVPWMHAALRKLNDTDGYSEAEIVRARGQAMYMATIESDDGNRDTDAQPVLEPGIVEQLAAGEKMNFHGTNSPNPSADPFLRFMLREIAAGIGVSYESLSRDYSQSNYSSSRLALLDDRDLWRIIQLWFIRSFRMRVHRNFLRQAVLSRGIESIPVEQYALDPRKFEKARFKPRGWSWVDPTKEVEAYKAAIKAGLTTQTDVIAKTADGRDIEDIIEERKQELEMGKAAGLVFDTDPELINADIKAKQPAPPAPDVSKEVEDIQEDQKKQVQETERLRNLVERSIGRSDRNTADVLKAIAAQQLVMNFSPVINNPAVTVPVDARSTITLPEQPVTVNAPVTVHTPENKTEIRNDITVPEQPVTVNAPVTVNTPEVKQEIKTDVHVPERSVTIDAPVTVNTPEVKQEIKTDVHVPERSVTIEAPVTVNTPEVKQEIKTDVHVPERQVTVENRNDIHIPERKGKRTAKLKDATGKVVRTVEMEE